MKRIVVSEIITVDIPIIKVMNLTFEKFKFSFDEVNNNKGISIKIGI